VLAGHIGQGDYSVAIGYGAGASGQANNTIILNASGLTFSGNFGTTGAFYVKPIRQDSTKTIPLMYDPATSEIVQGSPSALQGPAGAPGPAGATGADGAPGPAGAPGVSPVFLSGIHFTVSGNFIRDVDTAGGGAGPNSQGYYYAFIPAPGIITTSKIQVTVTARGDPGGSEDALNSLFGAAGMGPIIAISAGTDSFKVWVANPPPYDGVGFAWISF
jgi:hypothetical protein